MKKKKPDLKYRPQDEYFFKAKKEGFVARSVFKLEEIDAQARLYRTGMKVLDLGCAPGSWLQYAAKKVGSSGRVVGIDIDPVRVSSSQIFTLQMDLFELNSETPLLKEYAPFDFIQSDAMTKTTGIPDSDCARSIALVEKGIQLAQTGMLKEGGTFLAKVFEGPGFSEFFVAFKKIFRKTAVKKPEATRPGSREVYVLGQGFRSEKR